MNQIVVNFTDGYFNVTEDTDCFRISHQMPKRQRANGHFSSLINKAARIMLL